MILSSNTITIKQHYVPQVYLRGFSPEYSRKKELRYPTEKHTIYCYKLGEKDQLKRAIPIKSICYEKDLYELQDDSGQFIIGNYFEHCFAELERMFGEYRRKLEAKAFIKDNLKIKCFLTKDEKVFWTTYIVLQILRSPQVIQNVEDECRTTWKNELSDMQIRNLARQVSLPFSKEIDENTKEAYLFQTFWCPMRNMSLGVGVDLERRIITSDKTVFIYSGVDEFPCEEYERVIFPISAEICLFMFGREDKKIYDKNFLFQIDENNREEIVKSISGSAFEKIYSNHLFNEEETRYINEVEKDRQEDVKSHAVL